MKILFCMKQLNESDFLHLPGVKELLADLGKNSIGWAYFSMLSDAKSAFPFKCADDRIECEGAENTLVVTDSPALASYLKEGTVCCIGYQHSDHFFQGADIVLSEWEGLDTAFFIGAWRRFLGLPVILCETERLIIRESIIGDFDELYRMSCECTDRVFAEGHSKNCQEAKAQFGAYIKWQYNFFGFGLWTVEEKSTGRVIGRCGLTIASGESAADGGLEIGYLISADKRGYGYAQEAVMAVLNFAFYKLDCPEVTAVIDKDNIPSKRLVEKLGFRRCAGVGGDEDLEVWRMEVPGKHCLIS